RMRSSLPTAPPPAPGEARSVVAGEAPVAAARGYSRRRPITGTKRPRPVLLPSPDPEHEADGSADTFRRRPGTRARGSRSLVAPRRRITARSSLSVVNPRERMDEGNTAENSKLVGSGEITGKGRLVAEGTDSAEIKAKPRNKTA